ncbi:MAG TPA: hypothetical protein VGB66_18185 [Longimicrobium sp.]
MTQILEDPIDAVFNTTLLDAQGQPNLVFGGSGTSQLTWTLVNNAGAGEDLVVTPFASGGVSASQYHFAFTFSPGALTAAPAVAGWQVATETDAQGAVTSLYLALAGSTPLNVPPAGASQAQLTYTTAVQENSGSSKVTVTLEAGSNVTDGGQAIDGKEFGPFPLTLVPAALPPLSVPPVSVDFVGRRTVLNDGQTLNSFTFALTNLTMAELAPASSTVFTVWFDAAPNDPTVPYPWALAQVQDLAAASLTPPAGWTVHEAADLVRQVVPGQQATDPVRQVVPGNPQWALIPPAGATLPPQAPVLFTFSRIVTALDPGVARMYLQFTSLPGYADGILMAELEKSPLGYGATQGQGLYLSAGTPSASTPPAPNYGSGLYVQQFGSAAPAATLSGGTGLLIQDTQGPAATLDGDLQVNGNAVVTGTATVGGALAANAGAAVAANTSTPALAVTQSGTGLGLQLTGDADIGGNLVASGNAAISGAAVINGPANFAQSVGVSGSVGIGTNTPPIAALTVQTGSQQPSANGNASNGLLISAGPPSASLNLGIYDSGVVGTQCGWIQTAYSNSAGTAGTLALNPLGGSVTIGNAVAGGVNTAGALLVIGSWSLQDDGQGNLNFSMGGNPVAQLNSAGVLSVGGQRTLRDTDPVWIDSPGLGAALNSSSNFGGGANGWVATAYWMEGPDGDSNLVIRYGNPF